MARQDGTPAHTQFASLEDLLADDVTQAVMRADHVAALDVRGLCRAVILQRAAHPAAPPAAEPAVI